MLAFAAIPLTCWVCTLLAIPRRPLPSHEAQELAYRRLVGRQQLLLACAIGTTMLVALVFLLSAITAPLPGVSS